MVCLFKLHLSELWKLALGARVINVMAFKRFCVVTLAFETSNIWEKLDRILALKTLQKRIEPLFVLSRRRSLRRFILDTVILPRGRVLTAKHFVLLDDDMLPSFELVKQQINFNSLGL